ncbi:LysR family transcriptional regulator [Undibacter mobilis]|uniref:LysR family transcriptional regulator n=1 Tax=Undibacter mobilis TaxID=2292256 RepID=A0A371B4M2_9BRAD|nr:LysR family transcriptional regulator [Undibacter mobilis]RDV02381.1 LysR family transcriptional regulator [Undibacter mobilis]
MTLEQLRIFAAVAEREHVTQAARALNLTQSAVSAAVSALEARYGVRLFDRVGRRIELTESGRLFLTEARAVLARAAAAETVLTDLAGLKRGSLSLAASQTVASYWLPPLMARYREKYPGIALSLIVGNTETVAAMVREGTVDLGFVEGEIDEPALTAIPVADDQLIVVTRADRAMEHRQPKNRQPLGAVDLKAMRWVFRERGSATRSIFEDALAVLGVDPDTLDIVLELPSNEAVRAAVEHGAGAAALSKLAVSDALASGALTALNFVLPKRQFYAVRHRERWVSQAERELLTMAADGRETPLPLASKRKSR